MENAEVVSNLTTQVLSETGSVTLWTIKVIGQTVVSTSLAIFLAFMIMTLYLITKNLIEESLGLTESNTEEGLTTDKEGEPKEEVNGIDDLNNHELTKGESSKLVSVSYEDDGGEIVRIGVSQLIYEEYVSLGILQEEMRGEVRDGKPLKEVYTIYNDNLVNLVRELRNHTYINGIYDVIEEDKNYEGMKAFISDLTGQEVKRVIEVSEELTGKEEDYITTRNVQRVGITRVLESRLAELTEEVANETVINIEQKQEQEQPKEQEQEQEQKVVQLVR